MLKLTRRESKKKHGLPPGTVTFLGEKKAEKVKITVTIYNEDDIKEEVVDDISKCFPLKDKPYITWINIDGLHDIEIFKQIGDRLDLHQLLLEDIVNTDQRPKLDDHDDHIFTVLKMIYYNSDDKIDVEQVSLILGRNYVLTFQEKEGDVFDPIRDRLRNNKGRLRRSGADYLFYSLIDIIIDGYFIILERAGTDVESIEEELLSDPTSETLQKVHDLKRRMMYLRKSIWPLREVINGLERSETNLIDRSTIIYLRDVYDHTIQIIDTIESLRDIIAGMIDIYLSEISNRMNEVMKVLTIIATIFIPLTFIAGIYGMNFKYMPELEWPFGYFTALGLMVIIGILMIIFFKRKKWL